jgi:predicted nucleotidyltransferase
MEPQASGGWIARHREGILELARRHGASNVRLFGSVARGEADANDVDLLVTVEPGRSMLDLIRLQLELEDLLGVKVDIVEDKALHPLIREIVLHEAVGV